MMCIKSIVFLIFFVCVYAQYNYAPNFGNNGANYYPVSNRRYYFQPQSGSSCGYSQYSSYCQHLPCYVQPYYPPQNPFYINQNNQRVFNPYSYISKSKSNQPDPYANIPVEIIDDPSVPVNQNFSTFNQNDYANYANVPVEVIDDPNINFLQNVPRLPKISRSSTTNYTVNHQNITTNSISDSKPIRTSFSRSFDPSKTASPVRLDFLNGQLVTEKQKEEETTTILATTVESEDVSEVKSWFK